MTRHRYQIDLGEAPPPDPGLPAGVTARVPVAGDVDALAALMLDAYRGTIDYEGEGMAEAVAEVAGYLAGRPMVSESVVLASGGEIVSACLISDGEGSPLVGYVMTAAAEKRRGLGTAATVLALRRLHAAGHRRIEAYITEGNIPSERIFLGLGFTVQDR